jgi:hypothetical protein
MVSFVLLVLVVSTAVIGSTARGDVGGDALTAGFIRVPMTETRFVVQRPYDVPLHTRYEFAGGVRRMWVYSTDKPFSPTEVPGAARTETKINVRIGARWSERNILYSTASVS